MTIVVRIISAIGLICYAGFLFLLLALGGMSASSTGPAPGPMFFFGVAPFLYLLYCFFSSFGHIRGKPLLLSGLAAHLLILPLIILSFQGGSTAIVGIGGLVMTAAWFGMYIEKRRKHGD